MASLCTLFLYTLYINCEINFPMTGRIFQMHSPCLSTLNHCISKKLVRANHSGNSCLVCSLDAFLFLTLCTWSAANIAAALSFLLPKLASWPYFLIRFCLSRCMPCCYSTFSSSRLWHCTALPLLSDPWHDKSPMKIDWELPRVSSVLKYSLFLILLCILSYQLFFTIIQETWHWFSLAFKYMMLLMMTTQRNHCFNCSVNRYRWYIFKLILGTANANGNTGKLLTCNQIPQGPC
jgi:hypothetical protein